MLFFYSFFSFRFLHNKGQMRCLVFISIHLKMKSLVTLNFWRRKKITKNLYTFKFNIGVWWKEKVFRRSHAVYIFYGVNCEMGKSDKEYFFQLSFLSSLGALLFNTCNKISWFGGFERCTHKSFLVQLACRMLARLSRASVINFKLLLKWITALCLFDIVSLSLVHWIVLRETLY